MIIIHCSPISTSGTTDREVMLKSRDGNLAGIESLLATVGVKGFLVLQHIASHMFMIVWWQGHMLVALRLALKVAKINYTIWLI